MRYASVREMAHETWFQDMSVNCQCLDVFDTSRINYVQRTSPQLDLCHHFIEGSTSIPLKKFDFGGQVRCIDYIRPFVFLTTTYAIFWAVFLLCEEIEFLNFSFEIC